MKRIFHVLQVSHLHPFCPNRHLIRLRAPFQDNIFTCRRLLFLLLSLLLVPQPLDGGDEDDLDERNELSEEKPIFDPLDVRCLRKSVQHTFDQGAHGHHNGQICCDCCVEKVGQSEKGCHVAEADK